MPVWLMPFELYRLTIVTFRQCTKFCFFSKHKLSNSTWWLLVPPDVIFQMIKCITVFSGACNAPGSCFSLLLTQWTACLSCFMFFGMSSGLSVNFIIPALWLLQYFVLAFFFFFNAELIYFALRCYKSTGNLEWIWSKAVDECERNQDWGSAVRLNFKEAERKTKCHPHCSLLSFKAVVSITSI